MKAPASKLIFDFETTAAGLREGMVRLRLHSSEQELFDQSRRLAPAYDIRLPSPFQETALMEAGGWQQRPVPAGPAQNLGYRMWLSLPDEVRKSLMAAQPGELLRVAVTSTSSGLDDVPWEWLNAGADSLIAAMDSVRFFRLVPVPYPLPPLSVTPPVRVLLVLTNPKDERLLRPDSEVALISEGLAGRAEYRLERMLDPRLDALREMLQWEPHIVHYVGHSGVNRGAGNLILQDEREGTVWLPAAQLGRVLPASVRLVCLSTCVTAQNFQVGGLAKVAHCPAEIPLPTMIVNQYAITDTAVSAFWREFYPALIRYGGYVVEAFHQARIAASREPLDTWCWASFSLVVRDGTGHPLRLSEKRPARFAAELEAQWAARLANQLAIRMQSLGASEQKHWEKTLADEAARVTSCKRKIKS